MPSGTELSTLPSSDLSNGNTLFLEGPVTLSGSLNLPSGSSGLAINGNNNNTITVSNGGFVLPMNTTPNFPLQNVTITGNNNAAPVIFSSNLGGVNIPITGTVTFSNINTGGSKSIGVVSNGTFSIGSAGSTVQFLNDTEASGGAISVQNAAIAISGSAIFSSDTATSGTGGAISSAGNNSFTMTGPMFTFIGDTAALGGGAIFAQNNSVAITGDVTLSGNKAMGGNGGAVDEESNSVTIGSTGSTVTITGNTASANGGAIYSQNNAVTINGAVITLQHNAAGGNGGAIDENANNVVIGDRGGGSTVMITGNTATANGGAIYTGNTGVTVNGTNIALQQNMAGGSGGTIYENNGPVSIGDASGATVNIIGNTASANGGAIYDNNGSVTVNGNATLMNNMAPSGSGGAIYETNNAVLISNGGGNVSITGNTVGSNGGAVYEGGSGAVTIGNSGANIGVTSNSAGSSGGGIYSQGGLVTLTGSAITLQGNSAGTGNGGAVYAGNGFTLNANGPGETTIENNSAGTQGGAIYLNSGNLSLNAIGSDITFSGDTESGGAANAIYFNSGSATFNAAGGQILFFDPIESNPNQLITVNKTGPGLVSFDGSIRVNQSNIYAITTVQQGTFEIDNNAVYGVDAPGTSFTVNSGATLQGGVAGTVGTNQFTLESGATLNIAGRAPAGAPFSTFTIDPGTSTFQAGSRLLFNTFLGTDNSPSDLLIISGGSATGSAAAIFVTNTTGPGAETLGNGIPLVVAVNGGTTAPGTFQLGEPVVAGPFEYMLFRDGLNGTNPNDWFLRNTFVVPPPVGITPTVPTIPPTGVTPTLPTIPPTGVTPTVPTAPPTGITPTLPPVSPTPTPTPPITCSSSAVEGGCGNPFPPDPPPDPLPPGTYPIIGPDLATYGVVQPIARQLGLTTLGTMHERIGDTLTLANAGPDEEGWFRSAWGRVFGQQIDNRYQAFADPRASGPLLGLQAGIDVWRGSFLLGHRDVSGLYFTYGNANLDVDGLVANVAAAAYVMQRTGTLNLNAYSIGGYWTHYGPGGWYLDAVLQGTRYGGNAQADFTSILGFTTKLSTNGSGFISSLEGGYPLPLPLGPDFILEPQAQIIWQHVDFGSSNDGLEDVSLNSTSGTTGRLGVRGQWTFLDGNGGIWQPYGRFNVWHDWGGVADTSFLGSALEVPLVEQSTRLEFAAGLTYKLQPNLSFYGQAGYQFAIAPGNTKETASKAMSVCAIPGDRSADILKFTSTKRSRDQNPAR